MQFWATFFPNKYITNVLQIMNWRTLLHVHAADASVSLSSGRHFTAWMTSWPPLEIMTTNQNSVNAYIYVKNIPAKFHPDPIETIEP